MHPKDIEDTAAELAQALGSELDGLPETMRETTIDLAGRLAREITPEDTSRLVAVLQVNNAFRYAEGFAGRQETLERLRPDESYAARAGVQTTEAHGQTTESRPTCGARGTGLFGVDLRCRHEAGHAGMHLDPMSGATWDDTAPCPTDETHLVPRLRPAECTKVGRHGRHVVLVSPDRAVGCPGALR